MNLRKIVILKFLLSFFTVLVLSNDEDVSEEFDYKVYKYLIATSTGMAFQKYDNYDGSQNITYNCKIGPLSEGVVDLFDKSHPPRVRSLVIENCAKITVRFPCEFHQAGFSSLQYFEYLKIKNIDSLTLSGPRNCERYSGSLPCVSTDFTVKLNDINSINVEMPDSYNYMYGYRESNLYGCIEPNIKFLELKNIEMNHLHSKLIPSKISQLHLNSVKINVIKTGTVRMFPNETSLLTIMDSTFGDIEENAFAANVSEVKIVRNFINTYRDNAFSGTISDRLTFSENTVNNNGCIFEGRTANAQIINNTFYQLQTCWLSKIKFHSEKNGFLTLNVTGNYLNAIPRDIYLLNELDVLRVKENRFNCSCKLWSWIKNNETRNSFLWQFFTRKENNNLCANIEYCAFQKVLDNLDQLCLEDKFTCPEDKDQEDPMSVINSSLKTIISQLSNITEKLSIWQHSINPSSYSTLPSI